MGSAYRQPGCSQVLILIRRGHMLKATLLSERRIHREEKSVIEVAFYYVEANVAIETEEQ